MRTTILLSTLLLLAGCASSPQPAGGGSERIKQIDSPIVVTDGTSIYFKKHDGLLGLGTHDARARTRYGKSLHLTIRNCNAPSTCHVDLPATWTMELHYVDTNQNDSIATSMTPDTDPQDAMDTGIHIRINPPQGNSSTFSLHDSDSNDSDYPGGAPYFVQSYYHLTYMKFNPPITVGSNTQVDRLNCTAPCKFSIEQK